MKLLVKIKKGPKKANLYNKLKGEAFWAKSDPSTPLRATSLAVSLSTAPWVTYLEFPVLNIVKTYIRKIIRRFNFHVLNGLFIILLLKILLVSF
ncbi:hypothetical protein SAMN05421636_10314 [Pricia antarctica]|uniref:Uncharacterized protein n=1 Tax=Pricia antarctica TaxID=641691 RepID=A0A1G6ZLY6_9FLAO|nr:hypothetical protein SAMN05421636_10314 [Pricia antarctica]